jgi:hypothetical protein
MISPKFSIGQKSGGLDLGADCMQLNFPHNAHFGLLIAMPPLLCFEDLVRVFVPWWLKTSSVLPLAFDLLK